MQFHAERLAPEIVRDRIGRLELGELQDAFIDGGQGQIDRLLGATLDLHFNRLFRSRTSHVRRGERHLERARVHVHRHMRNAHRTARLGVQHGVPAGIDRHHHIGALAPLRRDRQGDLGAFR